jgi:uncharacterized protein
MILVDANLLVYAYVQNEPRNQAARTWLDGALGGSARVGLPWASLLGFLRLVTNPRVVQRPPTIVAAWRQVEEWLECETAWIPEPGDRHREILGLLLVKSNATSNLVPDAALAALAIEHGLVLCSNDGDFARFAGLNWHNPLAA